MSEKFESRYASTNGIKLHYKTSGDGKPLILLHGFPEFWYAWKNQIPALAKQYTVIAPDLRGYNLSSRPTKVNNYRMEVLAADIIGLMDSIDIKQAYLAGHDWGGALGWYLVHMFPERFHKYIALNIPHPLEMRKHLLSNFQQIKRSWYVFFFQLPYLPEKRISSDIKSFFYRALRGWCINKSAFSNEDIEKYIEVFSQKDALTAAINYYRANFRSFAAMKHLKKRPKIPIPVKMIWGEEDQALGKEMTFDTQDYCEQTVDISYVPNCSHWVQHEQPELVNNLMLEFLKD